MKINKNKILYIYFFSYLSLYVGFFYINAAQRYRAETAQKTQMDNTNHYALSWISDVI